MTLNDPEIEAAWSFCVKICFGLGITGRHFWLSDKTVREFAKISMSATKM